MKPRRSRWISVPDLTDQILKRSNKFATRISTRSRRLQLQAVRRLVAKAEERDEERFTKRVGREIYVRLDAVEALMPVEYETLTRLEVGLDAVAHVTRENRLKLNGQNMVLKEHGQRIGKLEEKQKLTAKFIADIQALDSTG
jgi:hypothetical protein